VTDGNGLPLGVDITAGQVNECTRFERVMEATKVPPASARARSRPRTLAGDKGYSARRIRAWLRRRRIRDVIPMTSWQRVPEGYEFDQETYRKRNAVERCVGWLKELRRIATRFEKLAVNYLAMIKLAIVGRYLRIAFPDTA
jgi:transposase